MLLEQAERERERREGEVQNGKLTVFCGPGSDSWQSRPSRCGAPRRSWGTSPD